MQSLKKTCSTILCNMSDTLSKEYCVHSRTFFAGKTLSKYYYCIYWCILLHWNTFFYNMPHWPQLCYAMCPVLFESNTASNERTFFTGKILSKSCSIYSSVLLQSNVTVHVLKEIPHYSPQSIQRCQFPGTYILCLNMSNLDKNVYVRIQGSKIPWSAQSC